MYTSISESEMEVMQLLWKTPRGLLFGQIQAALEELKLGWKRTTILTYLVRLQEKGMIEAVKEGRGSRYFAKIQEEEYMAQQTTQFINRVYGGNTRSLVSSLIKQDLLKTEEIEELKSFWEKESHNE